MNTHKVYVRVKVNPGMFSDERLVSVPTTTGSLELFVLKTELSGDLLEVMLINKDEDQALVRLPSEPLWGGRNAVVRVGDLQESDGHGTLS
jgi:hypothetical protein